MSDLPQILDKNGHVVLAGDEQPERFERLDTVIDILSNPHNRNYRSLRLFMRNYQEDTNALPNAAKAISSQRARWDAFQEAADKADFQRDEWKKPRRERQAAPETSKERKRRKAKERQARYMKRQKANAQPVQNSQSALP